MIAPHIKNADELVFFGRLKAMKVLLMPGMHVLSSLYCHSDEDGGMDCDAIVQMSYYGDNAFGDYCTSVSTISEDYTRQVGSPASYLVPKLTHFETFIMCIDEANNRGAKTIRVPGYKSLFSPDNVMELKHTTLILDTWRDSEWQQLIIDGLIDTLIEHANCE